MPPIIEKSDMVQLIQEDERLVGEIGRAIVDSPVARGSLVGGLASLLSSQLARSPEIRREIVAAAIASDEFKLQIAKKLMLRTRSCDSRRAHGHAEDPLRESLVLEESGPQPRIVQASEAARPSVDAWHVSARDVMSSPPSAVDVQTTLGAAYVVMQEHPTPHLLVSDGDRPVGVLLARDLVSHLFPRGNVSCEGALAGLNSQSRVFRIATLGRGTTGDAQVPEVAAMMLERNTTCLPVHSRSGRVIGVVTSADLIRLLRSP